MSATTTTAPAPTTKPAKAAAKPVPAPSGITEKDFLAKAKVEELKPSDLILHRDLQGRAKGADAEHVADIAAAYKAGTVVDEKDPPKAIRITEGANVRILPWDGHHTTTAAQEAKRKTIKVMVLDGTWADAVTLASQANKGHLAKKRSHADKERQLRMYFGANPKASARMAGEHVGVDDKTAGRVKAEMFGKGGTVVGKNGKEQAAAKPATQPAWRKAVFDEQIGMSQQVEAKCRELGVKTVGDLSDAIAADAKAAKPVFTDKERAELGEEIDKYQLSFKRTPAAPVVGGGNARWVPSDTQMAIGMLHRSLQNLEKCRPAVKNLPQYNQLRRLVDDAAPLVEIVADKAKGMDEAAPAHKPGAGLPAPANGKPAEPKADAKPAPAKA